MGGETTMMAAATARARRRVISHFMSRNAVSPEKGVGFTPKRRMEIRFFDRLRQDGVIVACDSEAWYLDVPKLDAYQRSRRRKMGVVLAGIAAGLAAGVGIGLLG